MNAMNEKRLNEINERKAGIMSEIDQADEARMKELETELDALEKEERQLIQKLDLRGRAGKTVQKPEGRSSGSQEERAKKFAENNRTSVNARALLVSGGKIAQSTQLSDHINDAYGVEVSSIVDMVTVSDCTGMGTYRVPYVLGGMEAKEKTEGKAQEESSTDDMFGYVDLTPTDFSVLSYVSKQIKKQTPLMYESKVISAARTALRKKASKAIINAVYSSELTKKYEVQSTAIDATTLRKLAFEYGGDEGIGSGVLILNKKDLIKFGDVRGTSEKKAIYEITPDAQNENTGIIKEGGLSVRYVINSNCKPLSEATETGNTMIYGNPKNVEMGLWGDIEISTSDDYKFAEGLLSVLGETNLDTKVVVKNGFIVVAYNKTA